MTKAISADKRAEALKIYAELGAYEAAARTGHATTSIRNWAKRAGVQGPMYKQPSYLNNRDWIEIESCSDADAAYAAGVIDGEGCVSCERQTHRRNKTPQHIVEVAVSNTDWTLMEWLKARFGGNVKGVGNAARERKGHRPCWLWRASNLQAETFLQRIRPFLIIKARQADVALELRQTFHPTVALPREAVIAKRDELARQLSALKRPA